MAAFDKVSLQHRLTQRYHRAQKRAQTKNARTRAAYWYVVDSKVVADIAKVVCWCQRQKVYVEFYAPHPTMQEHTPMGALFTEDKTIVINSHFSLRKQLYVLLHECGHYLVNHHNHVLRFKQCRTNNDARALVHRVGEVDEEFEAWHLGKTLAKKLNIVLDDKHFHHCMAQLIETYFKWAAKVPGWHNAS